MHIAGLLKNDMVDGLGFSVSLWTQGCPFRCRGCHNPETWDPQGGMVANKDTLINEIISSIKANGVIRNFSVLGGEPLSLQNVDDVNVIVSAVRKEYPDIKIMLWTGFTWEKLMDLDEPLVNSILNQIDVLIDGQFELDKRDITLWLRGSSNQRVIDVKESLKQRKVCEFANTFQF